MSKTHFIVFFLYLGLFTSEGQQISNQKCQEYVAEKRKIIPLNKGQEYPHMAALGFGNGTVKWICGGSLISENYILTAAHCLYHRDWGLVRYIKLGTTDLQSNDSNATVVEVLSYVPHHGYQPLSKYNDIALIKLKENVTFSETVFPICLNTIFHIEQFTNSVRAIGWGRFNYSQNYSATSLKVLDLQLAEYEDCFNQYRLVAKSKLPNGISDEIQICAGATNLDTCQGDSGGPLMMDMNGTYTIVGVTNFGKPCGLTKSPGVYTRVSAFVAWIEGVVWPTMS